MTLWLVSFVIVISYCVHMFVYINALQQCRPIISSISIVWISVLFLHTHENTIEIEMSKCVCVREKLTFTRGVIDTFQPKTTYDPKKNKK